MLNFGEEQVTFPEECREIFEDKKLIHDIVFKSGVIKIIPFSNEEFKETTGLFVVGRPNDIENFKILFRYQSFEYLEIKALEKKKKLLQQKLFSRHRITSASTNNGTLTSHKNFAEAVKSGIKH